MSNPCPLGDASSALIEAFYDNMKAFILEKDKRYGNSVLSDEGIFSDATVEQKLEMRLDDKLKRIMNSKEKRKNDFVDLIGYLGFYCIDKGWLTFDEMID